MDNKNQETTNTDSNFQETQNVQVTSDHLINWINSRRSIGNLTIPAPSDE